MATPINAAVLTASDSRTIEDDASGAELVRLLSELGATIVMHVVVQDDLASIRQRLSELVERAEINLVVTTGGTGLAGRDNTPEATRAVIEREIPGIPEAMRRETASQTPMAMLSRGVAGSNANTLVINFPGSPKAVRECFEVIRPVLGHAIDLLAGDTAH